MTAMLGKVVLITGSTSGIGLEAAKQFYRLGATVLMTCRDEIRGRKALDALLSKESAITASGDQQRVHLYTLDLMCYKSIITFCKDVLSDWRHIDDLVLNAGIMGKSFELSSDGIESHFATNMFGHYVIVNQLYELLSNGDVPSRVIVVSSGFYTNSPPIPSMKKLMGEEHWENYNSKHCYAISKLANCLYVKHLSQKFRHHGDKVQIFAVRPGFIGATELGRETHWLLRLLGSPLIWLVSQPVTKGVEPIVHLATNDLLELKSGGLYNNDCREEDYTTAVNLVDAANLFHLLYEMENTVLKRSRLEPQEVDMVKTRREWFV